MAQCALVGTEAHGSSHVGDVLLLLHDVDDVVWSLFVHLAAVGIGISENVACELNHHHLHSKTDAKCRDVVGAGVFYCRYLTFYASLSESGADDHTVESFEQFLHVALVEVLGVDECQHCLVVVVCSSLREALSDALVGILEVVFPDQSDDHLFRGVFPAFEEVSPWAEAWCLAYRHVELSQ